MPDNDKRAPEVSGARYRIVPFVRMSVQKTKKSQQKEWPALRSTAFPSY